MNRGTADRDLRKRTAAPGALNDVFRCLEFKAKKQNSCPKRFSATVSKHEGFHRLLNGTARLLASGADRYIHVY